jgi:hypothetical protein
MEHFWDILFQLMKPTLDILRLYFCSVYMVEGCNSFPTSNNLISDDRAPLSEVVNQVASLVNSPEATSGHELHILLGTSDIDRYKQQNVFCFILSNVVNVIKFAYCLALNMCVGQYYFEAKGKCVLPCILLFGSGAAPDSR